MTRWYSGSLRMLAHSAHCCKRVRGCRGLKAARYAPAWACWGCGCPCLQCVFILLCDSRGGRLLVNPFGFFSKAASSCCVASFSCSFVSLTAFHLLRLSARVWGFLSCGAGAGQG